MVIRALQQQRIRENIAQAQVYAHRGGGVGKHFFMGGYNFIVFHGFFNVRKTKNPANEVRRVSFLGLQLINRSDQNITGCQI